MKLRNKKTGEIIEFRYLQSDHVAPLVLTTYENGKPEMYTYNSLAELNSEWEDYEKPKEHYILNGTGIVRESTLRNTPKYRKEIVELIINNNKSIGNYFDTREEAEKAVRKLKAWKRLKDKGFKFAGYSHYDCSGDESPAIAFEYSDLNEMFYNKQVVADLDLLFGGEE